MSTATTHKVTIPAKLPTTFEALADVMIPHVIEDDNDFACVHEVLNRLVLLPKPTAGQRKYLDIIELTVAAYDEKHPIDTSDISGLDILKSLVADHGMTASDLGRILGNRALGAKVLSGARELSKANMRILGEHFKLDPGVFLR